MTMSTQTLLDAGKLLSANVLRDLVQLGTVGDTITVGINAFKGFTPVGAPVAGLVQSISLESANEGRVTQAWSIKVERAQGLRAGMAVKIVASELEPSLVGKTLLIDTVSLNGAALLTKGTATSFVNVNQEVKGALGA